MRTILFAVILLIFTGCTHTVIGGSDCLPQCGQGLTSGSLVSVSQCQTGPEPYGPPKPYVPRPRNIRDEAETTLAIDICSDLSKDNSFDCVHENLNSPAFAKAVRKCTNSDGSRNAKSQDCVETALGGGAVIAK